MNDESIKRMDQDLNPLCGYQMSPGGTWDFNQCDEEHSDPLG